MSTATAEPTVVDLYCRISVAYDGTLRAVEDQEAMGREWVASQPGVQLGEVHRDHALSGWDPKVTRPSFEALMARLESGAAGGVWVRDLDRFTRKVREAEALLAVAERGALVVARESAYDLTTARGKRNFREDAVDAAYESDRISERTSRGKRSRALRGRSNATTRGFGRPGFLPNPEGWEPGDPRTPVDPELLAREVDALRDAAARLLAGDNMSAVARDWNAAGMTTVAGGLWDGSSIKKVMTCPSVGGLIEHKGAIVGELSEGGPLDRDTWDRLQLHFASRKRGRPASVYLLSGFLRCGRCGATMMGRPVVSGSPYPDGAVRRQYLCQKRVEAAAWVGCGRLCVDQRLADAVVTTVALERLGDPRHADRLAQRAEHLAAAVAELDAEVARLEENKRGLASKVVEWGFEAVEEGMAKLLPRLADAQARRAELLEGQDDLTAGVETTATWEAATIVQRRAMVRRALPDAVVVGPSSSHGVGRRDVERFDFDPQRRAT